MVKESNMKKRIEELEKKVEYLLKYAKTDRKQEQKDMYQEAREYIKTAKIKKDFTMVLYSATYTAKDFRCIHHISTDTYVANYKGFLFDEEYSKNLFQICELLYG